MKNKKQNFSQHPKRKKMKIRKGWVIFFKTFLCVSFAFSLTLGGAWLFCQSTFEAAYSPEFNYSSSQKEPVAQTPSSSNNSEPSKPLQASSTSTPNLQNNGTAPLGEIPVILQKPELPAGCEATSASMLLCAYGYNVDKNVFAQALPKSSFETYNGLYMLRIQTTLLSAARTLHTDTVYWPGLLLKLCKILSTTPVETTVL